MSEVAVTDKRERMANQLLMRGHATMRELLEMSFGEWPVKGLKIDLNATHNQKVVFKLKNTEDSNELGYIYPTSGVRRIFYTDKLLHTTPREIPDTIGHEAVHLLQAEGVYWKPNSLLLKAFVSLSPFNEICSLFRKTKPEKIAQKFLSKEYSCLRRQFNRDISADLKYLNQAKEIQARLHEIVADSYQRWGRLPQNSQELMDALVATGAIKDSFESQSSPSIFKEKTPIVSRAARDIARLIKNIYFSRENKSEFTKIILPSLYVNLLELYGDKNARQRFGLDENYKPIKQELKQTAPVATPSPA